MQIHTACEKSVSICRTSGAICGLTNHPAWQFFTQHSKDPIPHYKTTRLFAEAYTPNLRKSPLFRFPQSLSCFLLQDNQRYFLLPHDIAPRLQVFPICVIRLEYVGWFYCAHLHEASEEIHLTPKSLNRHFATINTYNEWWRPTLKIHKCPPCLRTHTT